MHPVLLRTEGVMAHEKFFDLTNSESPQFDGRVVASMAADLDVTAKSGKVFASVALALEYGFTDVDGKQPKPMA